MLTINLEWDQDALAAPQSFRDGVQAAADILQAAIYDPITVNIGVGYGEYDLGGPDYVPLTSSYSLGGENTSVQVSYSALRTALAASETPAADASSVAALPDTFSLDGQTTFSIPSAVAKAFGAIPATDPTVDGFAGFPTSFTGDTLTDAAIIELIHALGLLNAGGDLGLFAYTSPGVNFLPGTDVSATPAYFSVDGGTTALANYNVRNDDTLFRNLPSDPLNYPFYVDEENGSLTSLDLTELSVIGYDDSSTPVLAVPTYIPTTIGAAAIDTQNVRVAENTTIPASSLIASVSVPAGDAIVSYGFDDEGSGNGHFSLGGVTEPDNQFFYVLDTQLTALTYEGGGSPASETILVKGFDYHSGSLTQSSALTATTYSPPVYSIAVTGASTQADGASGTTTYSFTASRSGDTGQASTLSYAVAGSGANPAPDLLFAGPTGTIAFAAGVSSVTVPIVVDGATISSQQTFTVTLTGPAGTLFGTASAIGTILPVAGASFDDASAATTITSVLPQAQTFQAYAHYDLYTAPASLITDVGSNLASTPLDTMGDVAVYTSADAATEGHVLRADGTGRSVLSSGDGDDAVVVANGQDLIATGTGTDTIYLVTGDNTAASEGTDTVDVGSGADTISASGHMVVNAGLAEMMLFLSPNATLALHTGTGSVTVAGGFGSGSFSGGTNGDNLLTAGTGPTTLYAGGNGDTLVASGGSSTTMYGWSGAETMVGQYSQGVDTFDFDAASVFATGGLGTNIFDIGSGNNNIVGLQGTDTFDITDGAVGGKTYISDFNLATDRFHLSGYAVDEASHALSTATYYQGSEILTLRDGTQLTTGHVTGLTQSNFV